MLAGFQHPFSSGSLSQPHLHADASAAWGLSILRAQGRSVDHDLFPYHRASLTMEDQEVGDFLWEKFLDSLNLRMGPSMVQKGVA